MAISAADVKNLRDRTNMPMMECKAALTDAGGNIEKAVELLRKKFKDAADKRVSRETAEGRIVALIDPAAKTGAIVEMRCESAPVAKSELFIALCNDIAKQIVAKNPATVEALLAQPFTANPKQTITDRVTEVIGQIRENMKPTRFARLTGGLGQYCHHDGSVGVLVQVEGDSPDPQILRDVSMHIVAKNPIAARREDVPADVIGREKEIAQSQLASDPKNANKPANILEMIIQGKLKAWYADNVLLEQPFVKDDSKTVGDLLKAAGLTFVKFVRYKVGETA
jgi:elongation factor Ts